MSATPSLQHVQPCLAIAVPRRPAASRPKAWSKPAAATGGARPDCRGEAPRGGRRDRRRPLRRTATTARSSLGRRWVRGREGSSPRPREGLVAAVRGPRGEHRCCGGEPEDGDDSNEHPTRPRGLSQLTTLDRVRPYRPRWAEGDGTVGAWCRRAPSRQRQAPSRQRRRTRRRHGHRPRSSTRSP